MFIFKLWRGEYSLARTYWLFYVVIWGIFSLPIRWYGATNEKLQTEYVNLLIFSLCLFVSYGSIVLVGLWRSSSQYKGRKLWIFLVKIIVCIGVLIQILTVLAIGKPSPMHGGILFLSAVIPFIAFHLIQTLKNKKYALMIVACLCLLIPALLFGLNFQKTKKVVWMPLTNSINMNFSNDKLDKQTTYLDFNSIIEVNGKVYAYIANEFMDDGKFKNSSKQYFEFNCSVPPKLRVLSAVSYKERVENGFGVEIGRNDDIQSTLAKSAVTNGRTYTGGWNTYDAIQKDIYRYCESQIATSNFDANVNQSLCSSSKRDMTILKAVCESR